MNDSVLHGFCQKCVNSIQLFEGKPCHDNPSDYFAYNKHEIVPAWFLSPQQMKMIYFSQEFANWRNMHQQKEIWDFLIHSPFLVAKILKENEEE